MFLALLRSLRPQQWTKNLFVLAPLVFAQRLTDTVSLTRALSAFAAFCCAASALYLFNDLRDREEDRRHPLKRRRPIASGALPPSVALFAAALLSALAAGLAARLGGSFAALLGTYVGINLLYSMGLKAVVILDVLLISLGFVLRVLGGAAAIDVKVSSWLLLCSGFLSLFLGFSKRRHELGLLAGEAVQQRKVLEHYSPAFLDQMINVVTASSLVSYALYAVSPETVEKFHSDKLVYTVPFVLFGIFRYLYLTYQKPEARNPTEAILTDPPFLGNLLLWGIAVVWIVYGFPVPPPG
jgi:4-hydroxybenzoate polyprenyltransferase